MNGFNMAKEGTSKATKTVKANEDQTQASLFKTSRAPLML